MCEIIGRCGIDERYGYGSGSHVFCFNVKVCTVLLVLWVYDHDREIECVTRN